MATIERSALIDASARDVWAILAEFGDISRWAPNVEHSCLMTDQFEGVGITRRIQTNRVTVVESVETWEPESTLAYRITGMPPVIKSVVNTWRITKADAEADDGGGTCVSLTTEIDAGPRPPQKLIAKAVGNRFAAASDQMLAGLAHHLESAPTTGATS